MLTFDQPLWWKATEILQHEPLLRDELVLILGQFHVRMSFVKAVCHTMINSGLSAALSSVYAENTGNNVYSVAICR